MVASWYSYPKSPIRFFWFILSSVYNLLLARTCIKQVPTVAAGLLAWLKSPLGAGLMPTRTPKGQFSIFNLQSSIFNFQSLYSHPFTARKCLMLSGIPSHFSVTAQATRIFGVAISIVVSPSFRACSKDFKPLTIVMIIVILVFNLSYVLFLIKILQPFAERSISVYRFRLAHRILFG